MSRPKLERTLPCGWCGKPSRNHKHADGTPCVVTCPRCGAEVLYDDAGDSLDHPTVESWEACRDVVGGPWVFAQVSAA